MWLGVNSSINYSPTSTTDFYNGITPSVGGYTIYGNKDANGPSIYCPSTDPILINTAKSIAITKGDSPTISVASDAIVYLNSVSGIICVNMDYPNIVTSELVLMMDSGFTLSYPTAGTTWYDLSGNGVNYTFQNGASYNSSISSGIISFTGSSSQYANSTVTLFNSSTFKSFTANLWVYPTGAGNLVQVNGQTTPSTGYHYSAIEITAGGLISFGQWISGMSTIATSSQSLNAWYNLVLTYNGTTAAAYVNGTSVGSSNIIWSSPGANTFFALMANTGTNMGTNSYASGYVGAFSVYKKGLSSVEVTQNFNSLRSRYGL